MRNNAWSLFHLGMKRRQKEVRRLRWMLCLAVCFFAFILLFQDNMNGYTMENNYRIYGKWLLQSNDRAFDDHPYLVCGGTIASGSRIFLWKGQQGTDEAPAEPDGSASQLIIDAADELRKGTDIFLGTIPEDFARENDIRLYEGHFPKTDREIVMELTALQTLGRSYQLGQEISFYVSQPVEWIETEPEFMGGPPGEQAVRRLDLVTYTLVGTMESYSARWNGQGDLPGAIVTESAFRAMNMDKRNHYFYALRDEYQTHDIWTFALELFDSIAASKRYQMTDYQVNTSAFYNPFWGNPEMYRIITVVLMLLSASILAYLMATYLVKRRTFFLRLREIGASSYEVWRMAAYECVGSSVPLMLAALSGSYALSILAVWLVSRMTGIAFFYVFSVKTLLLIVLCVAAVLAVSLTAALIFFSGRALTEKRKGLSAGAARRLLSRSKRKAKRGRPYLGARETLLRIRTIHPIRTMFLLAAGILSSAVFLICCMRILSSIEKYQSTAAATGDFQGSVRMEVSQRYIAPVEPYRDSRGRRRNMETLDYSDSARTIRSTIPDDFFAQVERLPGVEHIRRKLWSNGFVVDWEGKAEDPFFSSYKSAYAGMFTEMHTTGQHKLDPASEKAAGYMDKLEKLWTVVSCDTEPEAVWKEHQELIDPSIGDLQAFLRGEQVIVAVDQSFSAISFYRRFSGEQINSENYWLSLGASFDAGDRLELVCSDGRIPLTVAAVTSCGEYDQCGICIIGSDALLRRIAEAEGVECGYNQFRIDLNALSDRENTAKTLAGLCSDQQIMYTSYAETLRQLQNDIFRDSVTYGFFGLVLIILYLFIRSAVTVEENIMLERPLGTLRGIGGTARRQKKDKRWTALGQSLYLLIAFPLFYAAQTFLVRDDLMKGEFIGYFSVLLNKFLFSTASAPQAGENPETNPLLIVALYFLEQKKPWRMMIPLLLIILFVWLLTGRTSKGELNDGNFRLHS